MKPKKELSFQPDLELANRLRSRNKGRPKTDEERAAHKKRKEKKQAARAHLQAKNLLDHGPIPGANRQKRLGDPA